MVRPNREGGCEFHAFKIAKKTELSMICYLGTAGALNDFH